MIGLDNNAKPYHIGYVAGAFDMFHIGHLNLVRRAKEKCDYLVAGVISDERVFELKNRNPVIPCNERMQVVAGCRYVDEVIELPIGGASIRMLTSGCILTACFREMTMQMTRDGSWSRSICEALDQI